MVDRYRIRTGRGFDSEDLERIVRIRGGYDLPALASAGFRGTVRYGNIKEYHYIIRDRRRIIA